MITVKITMKIYFDDGTELEEDVVTEKTLDPQSPEDQPYDQEAIKSTFPEISASRLADLEALFMFLEDPSSFYYWAMEEDENGF